MDEEPKNAWMFKVFATKDEVREVNATIHRLEGRMEAYFIDVGRKMDLLLGQRLPPWLWLVLSSVAGPVVAVFLSGKHQ